MIKLEQLLQDIQFGIRILWKSPGLSATAIVLIALVIGGNTTLYSFIHALITKPAPGVQTERLVSLGWSDVKGDMDHAYPDFLEYVAQSKTLSNFTGFRSERFTLSLPSGSNAFWGSSVIHKYFEALGVKPVLGRTFTEDDDRLTSGLVAVVSYRVWQEQFRGADNVIGQPMTINGSAARIIGVVPPPFHGALMGGYDDVWLPLIGYSRAQGRERALNDRFNSFSGVAVMGQLTPGTSISEAQAEFTTISRRLNLNRTVTLRPYSMTNFGMADAATGLLAVFSIVTTLTLLIVCANVANLMLARAVVRQREAAVRQSLGASRFRILRMIFAENITVSLCAWAASCLIAVWTTKLVAFMIPADAQATHGGRFNYANVDFTPDWQVLGYAMALSLIGTMAFTIAPALRTWRQELLPYLKAGEHSVVQGRSKLSGALVVVQFALSVVLLTSAGLAFRSWSAVTTQDLHFNRDKLLLVTVNPTLSIADRKLNLVLLENLRNRLRASPDVESVSYVRLPPPYDWAFATASKSGSRDSVTVHSNYVGPDYLKTLGLSPILGREFSGQDEPRAVPGAMITESLARKLWPGESALGQTLILGRDRRAVEVIGVAPDAAYSGGEPDIDDGFVFLAELQDPAPPTGYAGLRGSGETTFYVRYRTSLEAIAPAVAAAVREVDARIPIVYTRTMDTQLESTTLSSRIVTTLLTLFSGVSLMIAAIGQYAVIAFDMRRRVREFGVRMAMGASSQQIVNSVMREGLLLTGAGLLIGFNLSVISSSTIASYLYGVTATDVQTHIGVFVLLAVTSLLACYLPARRAGRIDPMKTLRME